MSVARTETILGLGVEVPPVMVLATEIDFQPTGGDAVQVSRGPRYAVERTNSQRGRTR